MNVVLLLRTLVLTFLLGCFGHSARSEVTANVPCGPDPGIFKIYYSEQSTVFGNTTTWFFYTDTVSDTFAKLVVTSKIKDQSIAARLEVASSDDIIWDSSIPLEIFQNDMFEAVRTYVKEELGPVAYVLFPSCLRDLHSLRYSTKPRDAI